MGNTQDRPALRAEMQAAFAQVALEFPVEYSFYFLLAIRADGVYIFTTLERNHNIQTSFKIVLERS